jgi:beta-1,4-N-acetylglucosaminyltransferase
MLFQTGLLTTLAFIVTILIAASTHLLSILPPRRAKPTLRKRSDGKGHMLVVLGSGGHTAEMLLMLSQVPLGDFQKRTWVFSAGDEFSAQKAAEVEKALEGRDGLGVSSIIGIPRARRVHQSLITTPFSSLKCLWTCLSLLVRNTPDIILTNGPGTGVIVVLASIILRFFDTLPFSLPFFNGEKGCKTRVIYVESLARVKKLSLSGKLLRRFVDRFIVQWDTLLDLGEWTEGNFVLDAAKKAGDGSERNVEREGTKI